LYASVHWKAQHNESITNKIRTADLAAGFHVYGLSWHPDLLRWYLDGVEVARTPTPPGLDKPMYLLVNLAVGGPKSWPGAPDAGTLFPARMTVDYIRAYRDQDGAASLYAAPAR
jgi:beta-glucanase (GH16 family)